MAPPALPLRVLLVDEDPGDLSLIEDALGDTDLEETVLLSRAGTLEEALRYLARDEADVVLLDLRLRDSEGIDTLDRLVGAAPTTPVVVLGAIDVPNLPLEVLRRGADDFIRKEELNGRSLLRSLRYARERANREKRTAFLSAAVSTLAGTLDHQTTLRTLSHLLVPAVGDWCIVDIVDSGAVSTESVVAASTEQERLLEAKLSAFPRRTASETHPVIEALRTATSRPFPYVDEQLLKRIAADGSHLAEFRRLRTRSMLIVPLVADGEVQGAVTVATSESGRPLGLADQALVEALAAPAARAMANAIRFRDVASERERARVESGRALRMERLSSRLSAAVSQEEIAAVILEEGLEAFGAQGGAVLLADGAGANLRILGVRGISASDIVEGPGLPLGWPCPCTSAFRARRPLLFPDADRLRQEYPESLPMLEGPGAEGLIALPLVVEEATVGVVLLLFQGGAFPTNGDLSFLEEGAAKCAQAMQRARLFERERAAREEVGRAILARDEVMGIVAHDLRSPLGAVSIHASLLQEPGLPEPERLRMAAAIERCVSQMEGLIADLLDITRIEAHSIPLELVDLEPEAVLREAFLTALPEATRRSIGLSREGDESLARIRADRNRLLQVLSNLLSNAIRFTPPGGSVRVRAEEVEGEVLILVSDTGPGVPREDQPHLFDRFWQARSARRGGAGLGLAIAKGIVERHGGRIGVESAIGAGSTFFFTIPTSSAPDATLPPRPVVPAAGEPQPVQRAPGRILIVEDHPVFRHGIRAHLEATGAYEIVGEASSGQEAVRLARLLQPDLVVMDLGLSGMSGIEAMREIVALPFAPRVVALTGEPEAEALLPVLAAGGSGFVRKATAQDDLVPALEAALRDEVFLYPSGNHLLLGEVLRRQTGDEGLARLSEQERQVLALAAEGFTSPEIGRKLFLAPNTVDSYRSRAMRRLGLGSRSELVRFAVRTGLLSATPDDPVRSGGGLQATGKPLVEPG